MREQTTDVGILKSLGFTDGSVFGLFMAQGMFLCLVGGGVGLACIGQLPPAFIDYVLSRDLAAGVLLTGCAQGVCYNRFGIAWTEARLAGARDPHLRARVPRERLMTRWLGRDQGRELERTLAAFARRLEGLASKVEHGSPVPASEPGRVDHG
jgi:coenzyme F420-reducing hydrogenase delta subunit